MTTRIHTMIPGDGLDSEGLAPCHYHSTGMLVSLGSLRRTRSLRARLVAGR